jgi:hypothetical protein
MRNTPLRGFMKSPLRQEYKNTKTATESTGKYSHANTKGNVGDKDS